MSEAPTTTEVPPPPATTVTTDKNEATTPKRRGYKLSTALFFALIIIVIAAGKLTENVFSLASMWAIIAAAMLAFVLALGADLQGTALGIFINERNLMSLSRFQLAAWTILICSAFVAAGLARVFAHVADPLGLALPPEVWQLLGISMTSSVGASLIQKNKANKEPDPATVDKVADKVGEKTQETGESIQKNLQGISYANANPKDARITDMFEGDELANTSYIDVGKVQMFFFTLVTLVAYAVNIYKFMVDNTPATFTFPVLSSGLVALLGISHAAYLGSKSVDKTKTTT